MSNKNIYETTGYAIREKDRREMISSSNMYNIFITKKSAERSMSKLKKIWHMSNPQYFTKAKLARLEVIKVTMRVEVSNTLLARENKILKEMKR